MGVGISDGKREGKGDFSSPSSPSSPSSSSSSDEEYDERVVSKEEKIGWERRITHYSTTHRILLVGEGDFSFSLSLARAFLSGTNMVATSLDSQECLARKFSNGIENVRKLEELGCVVLHGVDATKMSDHFFLRTQRFHKIVYNFPHVGFKYKEGSNYQIELNKELVKGFLKNAKSLLIKNGEIHVSHKIGAPYDQWNLAKKAEKNGLILKEVAAFSKDDYPGYSNKRADGSSSDDSFALGECCTYKFGLKAQD